MVIKLSLDLIDSRWNVITLWDSIITSYYSCKQYLLSFLEDSNTTINVPDIFVPKYKTLSIEIWSLVTFASGFILG